MGKRKWMIPTHIWTTKISGKSFGWLSSFSVLFCIFQGTISIYHFHNPRETNSDFFFLSFKDTTIYKTINPNFLNKYMRSFNSSVFLQSNDLELCHASSSNGAAISIIFINSFSRQPVNYRWKSILLSYTCFNNDGINEINYRTYVLCWVPDYIRLFARTKSTFLKVEDFFLDLHIFDRSRRQVLNAVPRKMGRGCYICLFSFSYPLTSLLSVENVTSGENVKIFTGPLFLE